MLSTVWNTQRGSWSYIEKRRGREEIEVTWGRKGRFKRGDSKGEKAIKPVITPLSKNEY